MEIKKAKYKRDYKAINKDKFARDLKMIIFTKALKANGQNIQTSLGNHLQIILSLFDIM